MGSENRNAVRPHLRILIIEIFYGYNNTVHTGTRIGISFTVKDKPVKGQIDTISIYAICTFILDPGVFNFI